METSIEHIAALIGDPVRVRILWTLLDGRAYTARELAIGVETSPQNLSMHLSKLLKAGLLSVEAQGRHRYYSFSREEVAFAIEAMANLVPPPGVHQEPEMVPINYCRTCYDHLAGKVGVLVTDSLVTQKIIEPAGGKFTVTAKGTKWLTRLDIDCLTLQQHRRAFTRACLDWTERRSHLAGALGAALLKKMLDERWIRHMANSRAVLVTPKGQKAFREVFGITL